MERITNPESYKRFRNPWFTKKNTEAATRKEFEDAIQTGIQDAITRQLTARQLKDRANTVSSWIESNKDSLNLNQKEEETFTAYRNEIHEDFSNAKHSIVKKVEYTQSLRDNCYKYFEFGQMLQDPVERFYFAKDIRPLTPEEIQEKNAYFNDHYDFEIVLGHNNWDLASDAKSRINVLVYNKGQDTIASVYENGIDLKSRGIKEFDNNYYRDTLGQKRMHLSDIGYQTVRVALEWLKSTDNPEFKQYQSLSIDNFQPRILFGYDISHDETMGIVSQVTEEYKSRKQANQPNRTFFFPSDSDEFKQIALGTTLGKGKLYLLRNYFPNLRPTGIRLKDIRTPTGPIHILASSTSGFNMECPLEEK